MDKLSRITHLQRMETKKINMIYYLMMLTFARLLDQSGALGSLPSWMGRGSS